MFEIGIIIALVCIEPWLYSMARKKGMKEQHGIKFVFPFLWVTEYFKSKKG